MKKKQKNKQKNNLIIAIVGVIAVVLIIAGSTYAYWSWETATNQQTSVSVTVRGAEMTIVGDNISSASLRPTQNCAGPAAVYGEATVTVTNYTATGMTATPRLNVTLTIADDHGSFDTTASNPDLKHLHWALVDITSSTTKTCANPDYQGTFNAIDKVTVTGGGSTDVSITGPTKSAVANKTMATFNITNMTNSSTTDFSASKYTTSSTLTFNVGAATTNQQGVTTETVVTKTYRVYVWLDDTYTHTNVGSSVTDPMQDLSVVVQWSDKSTLEQN